MQRVIPYEKTIEFSTDGIYVVDGQGITLYVNTAYEEITGYARNELVGRHMRELINAGYFDQSVSLHVLERKQQVTILQKIGQQQKDVMVTGNPIFDDHNNIQLVVTSVRDITQLTRMTNELKRERSRAKMNRHMYTFTLNKEHTFFLSPQMNQLIETIERIADFPTSVLLLGPTGAGKEVLANLIHSSSSRKDNPFIKINCGAIPENLIESELFGYSRGAFSGASSDGKIGLLELADGGTVLLDEVAELPLAVQVKLLRVLQDKHIQRLGSVKSRKVDIRLISATNKPLRKLVEEGRFREDLYYRLQVIELIIPPLRERSEDLLALIDYFFDYYVRQYSIQKMMDPATKLLLLNYHWPGNVRELKNVIESMVVSVPATTIEPDDLPRHLKNIGINASTMSLKEQLNEVEKRIVYKALEDHPSLRQAAKQLGIDHSTLIKKLQKWESC
ncbi:sigma-54 interaction domain-containing protein [Paenalkalicoccus suaedae]|uniref:sigma-54 interaction domain-containing protein n=1 Tax=Paenalkalicoccus suaedae TaxID=2592382 RepID=UPI00201C1D93|nr:sigma 54-interacting transcriptional regulator [Paenalkalicoccus suaedae]